MKSYLVAALMVCPVVAVAQASAFDDCFAGAATRYGINKSLLVAIGETESHLNAAALGPANKDGSYDIGLMQINSSWLPTLRKYGLTEKDLRSGCTNIYVGAWIMANNISRHGSTWNAVGAYNAKTISKRVLYVQKVQKNFKEIPAQAVVPPPITRKVEIKVASN